MSHTETTGSGDRSQGAHVTEDLCRDLINGFLSPTQKEKVLAHISACGPCERFFAERVVERERLRASIALRARPDGEIAIERTVSSAGRAQAEKGPLRIGGSDGERSRTHGRRPDAWTKLWIGLGKGLWRPRYGFTLGLAAAAVILAVVLWPRQEGSPPIAHLQWLPTSITSPQLRATAEANANEDLAAGLEAYADRDAERAIDLLQMAEASGQIEILRRVYLGSALALDGRFADAASVLITVRAQILPDPWGSEARWTLFVALRGSGRTAAADSLLRVMAQERGEVGERARRWRGQ